MTHQKLEEKLYDLLIKSNEPFVASISGEWGIGKTYFWQKIFLEKYKNVFRIVFIDCHFYLDCIDII